MLCGLRLTHTTKRRKSQLTSVTVAIDKGIQYKAWWLRSDLLLIFAHLCRSKPYNHLSLLNFSHDHLKETIHTLIPFSGLSQSFVGNCSFLPHCKIVRLIFHFCTEILRCHEWLLGLIVRSDFSGLRWISIIAEYQIIEDAIFFPEGLYCAVIS